MAVYNSMADFHKKLKRWEKEYPDDMAKASGVAGEVVNTEVQTKHLSGPKMAKGVGSDKHATLQPRSGDLRSSISVRVYRTTKGIKTFIGTFLKPLKYAKWHEKGSEIHPKRPFLSSSLSAKRKKIVDIYQKAMKRSYDNA